MGILFSNCAIVLARRKARSRGARCIVILKETEVHLAAMQQKYQKQLEEVDDALKIGAAMPNESRHEKETRKDRLLELLRKRKVLRHYLTVCRKRNNQVLAKVLAIEQLELNSLQLGAIKSTAEAFESFSKKTGGLDSIEDAHDKLTEHMETLADIDGIVGQELPLAFNDDDDDELLEQLALYDSIPDSNSGSGVSTMNVSLADLAPVPTNPPKKDAEADTTPLIGAEKVLAETPIAL